VFWVHLHSRSHSLDRAGGVAPRSSAFLVAAEVTRL
jgi:hypothetical protein